MNCNMRPYCFVISHGASPNDPVSHDVSSCNTRAVQMSTIKYRWTDRPMLPGYLLQAVQRGEVKKVRNWLLRGGSVDAQCTGLTGHSLLHAAAVYERCQLVTELIDRGAT
eukprot:scaffold34646_cov54-Phaeocystis_antarctica.AAC.2